MTAMSGVLESSRAALSIRRVFILIGRLLFNRSGQKWVEKVIDRSRSGSASRFAEPMSKFVKYDDMTTNRKLMLAACRPSPLKSEATLHSIAARASSTTKRTRILRSATCLLTVMLQCCMDERIHRHDKYRKLKV